MAWATEPTAVAGAVATSADQNTNRDNVNWLRGMVTGTATELVSPGAWGDRPTTFSGVTLGTGDTTIYTCPADTIAIVTEVRFCSYATAAKYANIKAAGEWDWRQPTTTPVPAKRTISIPCWIVLYAGETLQGAAESATSIIASATVWTVSSSMTGLALKRGQLGSATADGWRTLLSPTAGKTLVVKHVALQMGATAPTRVLLGWNSVEQFVESSLIANETVHCNSEIQVPSGQSLQVYFEGQDGAHCQAFGWEV